MAVFATLAVVKMQADISTSQSHAHRARLLAEQGVALAVHNNIENGDPLLFFQDPAFAEGYEASRTSLAQSFGINTLAQEVMHQQRSNESTLDDTLFYLLLTEGWGVDPSDAQVFLHCVAEWVDADDQITTLTGWERSNYEREGFPGFPYNRFFKSLEEVTYVHGFDAIEEAQPSWRSFFNIWTTNQVDIASASPEIISLASLTSFGRQIPPDAAAVMQADLLGPDGIQGTEDDLDQPNLETLLSQAASGDISTLINRYTIDSDMPQYSLITSKGWSGSISATVKLALQTQSDRPLILERTESIDHNTHEEQEY